jgi:hypothetical protein
VTLPRLSRLACHRVTAAGGIVSLAGVAAFARSIAFKFVYDDHWTIGSHLDMPLGRLIIAIARGAGRELQIPDETRPAMVASMWIDHALFGPSPVGYHVHSVLLYGIACALATWAALAIDGHLRVALVAGLTFALAPIHAEVVCAINYREDIIATVGVLVPIIALLRKRPNPRALDVLTSLCWLVGLLGKESAASLLVVLASLGLVPAARARMLAHRRLLIALAVSFVAWAAWRGALLVQGDDIPRAPHVDRVLRLFATARFCVRVGLATLFPFWPSPEYARPPPASALWLLALGGWVAVAWLLARRRRTRTPGLGLALILFMPLPASPLMGPANEMADRYAFLGVLGTGLVWGWLASFTFARVRARWEELAALGVAGLCMWAFCQSAAAPWRSDLSLWLEATQRAPTSPRAWVGLSQARRIEGNLDEAERAIERAIALDPKFIAARVTHVYDLLARGDLAGARSELGVIHELGGDHHRGVSRAARCAALTSDAAASCIR